MKRWLFVCAFAFSQYSLAQSGDWRSLMAQGYTSERAGEFAEAAGAYRNALRIVEQSSPPGAYLPNLWNALASASIGLGDLRTAESCYRQAMSVVEATGGKKNADYALLLGNLANLYSAEGRQAGAETMLRQSLATDSELFGAADTRTATAAVFLAQVQLARGNYQDVELLLQAAIPVLTRAPASAERLLIALNNLGALRFHQGRLQEAASLYERSLAGFEADLGPTHPLLLRPLNNLAQAYAALGRAQDAEAAFRRACAIGESGGKTRPDYAGVLANFAGFLRKNGRKTEAKELQRNSQEAMQEYKRNRGVGMTVDVSALRLK